MRTAWRSRTDGCTPRGRTGEVTIIHSRRVPRCRTTEAPFPQRGGGGVKSLAPFGARYRVGLTHRFFLRSKTFEYFSRNQRFKHCSPSDLSATRTPSSTYRPCALAPTHPIAISAEYFSGPPVCGFLTKNAAKFRVGGVVMDDRLTDRAERPI